MPGKVVMCRHGESTWNQQNLFTGWTDVDLTQQGIDEARTAGRQLRELGATFDIAFTSVLKRAIRTLWLMLDEMDLMWVPVKRTWRLNERHYGALQGLDKDETRAKHGAEQVHIWRRSYDVAPPDGESLKTCAERTIPCLEECIIPDLTSGKNVLVTAHGNSLRSIVMHIEGLTREQVLSLELPTGVPRSYEFADAGFTRLD